MKKIIRDLKAMETHEYVILSVFAILFICAIAGEVAKAMLFYKMWSLF